MAEAGVVVCDFCHRGTEAEWDCGKLLNRDQDEVPMAVHLLCAVCVSSTSSSLLPHFV